MPLEQHLILARYCHSLFGARTFEQLKDLLRDCSEDVDEEGTSYFCRRLLTASGLKIAKDALLAYDLRILDCAEKLRISRDD